MAVEKASRPKRLTSGETKVAQLDHGEASVYHHVFRLHVAVRNLHLPVQVVQPANDPGHQAATGTDAIKQPSKATRQQARTRTATKKTLELNTFTFVQYSRNRSERGGGVSTT